MLLRSANQQDIPRIAFLLMRMHEESGMGKLNMPKVERYIGATLARGVILIVEDDDLPIATMGLRVQDFWWSDDTALVDAFTYVAPEGRKSSAFRMMFRKAKEMANKAHMPLLMANFGHVDEERKSKLFRRIGKPMGTTIITGDTSHFLWK